MNIVAVLDACVLFPIIKAFFPESIVYDFESLEASLELPDPEDRHVLDAAIRSESQYIVTNNLKDFPADYLAQFNIEAISLDRFLQLLIKNQQEIAKAAFLKMVSRYKKEPKTPKAVLERLEKESLSMTVKHLKELL